MGKDYQKGKIYSLRSSHSDEVYYGSTIQKLSVRKAKHIYDYKRYLAGKYHYVSSFNVIKYDDCRIVLEEAYPCNSKAKLEKREGEIIREKTCINKLIPGKLKK